ncbi:phosphotransferase family protein [Nocardia sp. NPDC127526]|uniref:phosphotransferase family protein n=1 Tax=Nocardia sp. NPDC127526 TaxID=3345393 RepID=UPI00363E3EA8
MAALPTQCHPRQFITAWREANPAPPVSYDDARTHPGDTHRSTVTWTGKHECVTVYRGQFHDVVVAADRVYRFARTDAAAARMSGEREVLCAIARIDLGVATPVPLEPTAADEVALAGRAGLVLTKVPGWVLTAVDDTNPVVCAHVAAELARLLRAMSAVPGDLLKVLPRNGSGQWAEFASGVRDRLYPLMSPRGRTRADRKLAAVQSLGGGHASLVHGDLGAENMLWDSSSAPEATAPSVASVHRPRGSAESPQPLTDGRLDGQRADGLPRLVGVIDWDGAALGDPAEDVASIAASYGWAVASEVVDRAGIESSADLLNRARAIAATFALQQALAAAEDNDEEELADGLAGYR